MKLSEALARIDSLPKARTLFAIDEMQELIGTLTDGDLRRAILNKIPLENSIKDIVNRSFSFIEEYFCESQVVDDFKNLGIQLIPVLENRKIVNIFDLNHHKAILPIDVIIMAGGKGSRLSPLTDEIPKPLLKVGDKCMIDHLIDRLILFGIRQINIAVHHMSELIIEHIEINYPEGNINCFMEDNPSGTIGAVKTISLSDNSDLLVLNADLLTNIDFENLFISYKLSKSDAIVATKEYIVDIPFGTFQIENNNIVGLTEKPTYSYQLNTGIYLFNKSLVDFIPEQGKLDATDFLEDVLNRGKKISFYTMKEYWLDIGSPKDFENAQKDIHQIDMN